MGSIVAITEIKEEILENVPQKSIDIFHIEHELTNFNRKGATKLTVVAEKMLDKCLDFYKRVLTMHNKFHTSTAKRLQEFPRQEEHVSYLHDRLQEDELNIQ